MSYYDPLETRDPAEREQDLMDKLVRYLRANGTHRVVGTILKENRGMLDLARSLGFKISLHPEDPDLRWAELELEPAGNPD